MVLYGGLRRLSDAPEDQNVSFPHPRDVLGCVENSYIWRKKCLYRRIDVKKKYILLYSAKIILLNMTLGQIFWFNSSSAMVLKYIFNWGLMQNVFSSYFSVATTFLHSLPDEKRESSFAQKVTFNCIE